MCWYWNWSCWEIVGISIGERDSGFPGHFFRWNTRYPGRCPVQKTSPIYKSIFWTGHLRKRVRTCTILWRTLTSYLPWRSMQSLGLPFPCLLSTKYLERKNLSLQVLWRRINVVQQNLSPIQNASLKILSPIQHISLESIASNTKCLTKKRPKMFH